MGDIMICVHLRHLRVIGFVHSCTVLLALLKQGEA